jgi:hypothetical protein
MRRTLIAGLAAGLLFGGTACHHCCKKKTGCCPEAGGLLGDPVPAPRGTIPPTAVPTTPPSDGPLPPPVIPDSGRSSFSYQIDPRTPPGPWDPAPTVSPFRVNSPPAPAVAPTPPRADRKELLVPDPLPGGVSPDLPLGTRPSTSGFLEDPVRSIGGSDLPPRTATEPAPPGKSNQLLDDPTTRLPTGLPGYARVPGRDGVASGRKPTLDGFDWLRTNGFRTVVYLHAPSADVTPARELAEKRGLRFVPVAVSPGTLKRALDEFTAAVGDRANKPLYVIDEDGVRAGSLWYLVFRTQDLLGDDTARLRAAPLGLTEAATEEQKQFWVAIQDVLAKR